MPARRKPDAQPKLKRLAWCDGQMIRNQCHPRTRRFLRSTFQRLRRQPGQYQQGEQGNKGAHPP
jgi:hypothetical protein